MKLSYFIVFFSSIFLSGSLPLNSEITNFEDKNLPQVSPESLFLVCYDSFEFPYKPEELRQLNNISLRNITKDCYQDLIRVIKILESVETLRQIVFMDIEIDLPIEVWNLIQVKKLTIFSSNIESIPTEIGQLSNLEFLYISYSNITDLPNELVRLDSLREVRLSSNKLTRIPAALFNMGSLERLQLDYNEINYIPREITNLKSLQKLDLRQNQLTSVPTYISELPNLATLDLGSNQIHSLPHEITKLSNLIELDLSANQIETLPDSIFSYPSLRQLNLSNNKITKIPTIILHNYALESLNLSYNKIDNVPEELFNLKGLSYHLGLAGNNISELSNRVFDLKELFSLSLHENPYSFEDLRTDFNKRYNWFYILTLIIKWCPFFVYAFFLYKVLRADISGSRSKTILYYMFISMVVGVVTSWIIPYLHYHLFKLEFFYIRVFAEEWWKLLFPLYGAVFTSLTLLVISFMSQRNKEKLRV